MRWPGRSRARDSDAGSLPMALLVVLVSMSLTAALVPTVVSQIKDTRTVTDRTVALDAAQAGLDATLAQLRSAVSTVTINGVTSVVGTVSSLPPCLLNGLTDVGGLRFAVKLQYYGYPSGYSGDTPIALACPATDVPTYAILTSTGAGSTATAATEGASGTRTLEARYTFLTSDENISGGPIMLGDSGTLCLDAGDDPQAGDTVMIATCVDGGTSSQRWVYNDSLNIKLGIAIGGATGLCLDASTKGAEVKLAACAGLVARQEWGLTSSSTLRGSLNGTSANGYCLNAQNAGKAGKVVLDNCGSVWRMDKAVGTGMADLTQTKQLVNFGQFSRCLDVTDLQKTWPGSRDYLIVWFCKQDPSRKVEWNQRWTTPAKVTTYTEPAAGGQITVDTETNGVYCLTAPDVTGKFPVLARCGTGLNQKWRVYGDTGDPVTRYRIMDSNGRCLTAAELDSTDIHTDKTAKALVTTCSRIETQKWDAPATATDAIKLQNVREK